MNSSVVALEDVVDGLVQSGFVLALAEESFKALDIDVHHVAFRNI